MAGPGPLVMPGDRLPARALRFDGSEDHWAETASGLVVPTYAAPPVPPPMPVGVDLFCGAGGFSIGFHQSGYHVAAASEIDVAASATYLVNLGGPDTTVVFLDDITVKGGRSATGFTPGTYAAGEAYPCREVLPAAGTGWIASQRDHELGSCANHVDDPKEREQFCHTIHAEPIHRRACEVFFLGDVRRLNGRMILDALGLERVDCVVGGPPCQGFSKASARSAAERRFDSRNLLVFEFARLVLETSANAFVMENVPQIAQMLTPEGVPVLDALSRVFEDGGFGAYETLRRSLLANVEAGAGAALRGRPDRALEQAEEDDEGLQMSLFADATTPASPRGPGAQAADALDPAATASAHLDRLAQDRKQPDALDLGVA